MYHFGKPKRREGVFFKSTGGDVTALILKIVISAENR